jgi:hypothetical protein
MDLNAICNPPRLATETERLEHGCFGLERMLRIDPLAEVDFAGEDLVIWIVLAV